MAIQNFSARLRGAIREKRTPVLVGLDPRLENLPPSIVQGCDKNDPLAIAASYQVFCRGVIDAIADLVPAVKPQAAFFEQAGPAGMRALADTIAYARKAGLLVILDGKRNDIGTTATAYARAYLGEIPSSTWGADALTVSPYLGDDSLAPFVDVAAANGAGIFVLVKTSNPGGGLFQDLTASGKKLYEHVADYVQTLAQKTSSLEDTYGIVGAVVGATYPEQLADLRRRMPNAWLLVPGFGAQGGAAQDVAAVFDRDGLGAIINNSRGIIFAYERPQYSEKFANWQDSVAAATRDMIEQLRSETPAGRL